MLNLLTQCGNLGKYGYKQRNTTVIQIVACDLPLAIGCAEEPQNGCVETAVADQFSQMAVQRELELANRTSQHTVYCALSYTRLCTCTKHNNHARKEKTFMFALSAFSSCTSSSRSVMVSLAAASSLPRAAISATMGQS